MNQPNSINNPDSSGDVPLKRKRGRPRKYPRPHVDGNAHIQNVQNVNRNPVSGVNAHVPPVFERVSGNQPHRRDLENDLNDPMVGQEVSCVIEAVFDAGYLLSAKVGNSNTTLRGLVFKPGHYAPISAENDVAPGVPMIQRNEVPFPTGIYTQVQNPPQKERNKKYVNIQRNESRTMKGPPSVSQLSGGAVSSCNLIASQGKNVASSAEQPVDLLSRGNVVPVVLQPFHSSNGVLVSNQSSQVMTQAAQGSGSSVTKDIPAHGNQAPLSQIQTSQNVLPVGVSKDGPCKQSLSELLHEVEAKSMRLPSMPFEKLVTEVDKRIQTPESICTVNDNSKSGDKIFVKDSSGMQEEKDNEVGQPLLIKPLQAVQAGPQEHSASRPSESNETGKMTDLSQVKQTLKIENQASKAEELGSGQKLDGTSNSGTELDGKTGQST
ncbi:uncharacterized protein G2W53_029786 [Senna tora]|uniref:AT hook motif-containing protein n=1 Tax=Senna tora TaxID=362788 RepID=A0A834T5T6_9FABA|nr:uncharacterized protein G2W53_029786 [Senna tora]